MGDYRTNRDELARLRDEAVQRDERQVERMCERTYLPASGVDICGGPCHCKRTYYPDTRETIPGKFRDETGTWRCQRCEMRLR